MDPGHQSKINHNQNIPKLVNFYSKHHFQLEFSELRKNLPKLVKYEENTNF